jgi:hypothetical protein
MLFPIGAQDANYDADPMLGKFARDIAAFIDDKHATCHVRYDSSVSLVNNLNREILEGKHDDALRTKAVRAIYDLLRLEHVRRAGV